MIKIKFYKLNKKQKKLNNIKIKDNIQKKIGKNY